MLGVKVFCEVQGLKVNPSRRANLDLLSSDDHEESGGGEAKETSKIHQEQVRKGESDERESVLCTYTCTCCVHLVSLMSGLTEVSRVSTNPPLLMII